MGAPLHLERFCSLMYLVAKEDNPDIELFYADMRLNGIHVWPGRPWFLTLSHTDAQLAEVLAQTERSLTTMHILGFLNLNLNQPYLADMPPVENAKLGRDEHGRATWYVPSKDVDNQFEKCAS
jgi:hypothetical protein